MRDVDAAWIAGLFDGEGCVSAYFNDAQFRIRCRVAMTCCPTILRATDLLDEDEIAYRYYEQEKRKYGWKRQFIFEVGSSDHVLKFSNLLLPYAVTKKLNLLAASRSMEILTSAPLGTRNGEVKHRAWDAYRKIMNGEGRA